MLLIQKEIWLFLKPAPGSRYRLLSDVENMESTWLVHKTQEGLPWRQSRKRSPRVKHISVWLSVALPLAAGGRRNLGSETIICVFIAYGQGAMTQICFKDCPQLLADWLKKANVASHPCQVFASGRALSGYLGVVDALWLHLLLYGDKAGVLQPLPLVVPAVLSV